MPIETIEINGGNVAYEFLGPESGELIVMTPAGRFGMDLPGFRPLAEAVVAGGFRVLLWDRPNCGLSDVQLCGRSESDMRADTLAGLMAALGLGPCMLAGGSGGARDSVVVTIRYPELVTKMVLWNIVGGISGTLNLAHVYILPYLYVLRTLGIEGLIKTGEWARLIERNPRNEERLRALGTEKALAVLTAWLDSYVPKPGFTMPGVEDIEIKRIKVPTLIIRGGKNDFDHPKRTSLELSCVIGTSTVVDPPWAEDAWEKNIAAASRGEAEIFGAWPQVAPLILDFAKQG